MPSDANNAFIRRVDDRSDSDLEKAASRGYRMANKSDVGNADKTAKALENATDASDSAVRGAAINKDGAASAAGAEQGAHAATSAAKPTGLKSLLHQAANFGGHAAGMAGGAAVGATKGAVALGHNIAGAVSAAFTKIGTFFVSAGSGISAALGVSANVGGVMVAGALSAALGIGGVGAAAILQQPDDIARTVGLIDCAQAVDEAMSKYGQGDREIPETYNGLPVGTRTTFEFTGEVALSMLNHSSEQYKVAQAWQSAGSEYDSKGFCKIGDCYIVAVSAESFGISEGEDANVGDVITFYFDNGQGIDCIVGDTKNPSDPNYTPWGHEYPGVITTLEFWGDFTDNYHYKYLSEELGWSPEAQRVCSFTNNGPSDAYLEAGGAGGGSIVGGANHAASSARNKGRASAIDACAKVKYASSYDNSDAANAAISLAYSQAVKYGEGYPGTALYLTVHDEIFNGDWIARSCDRSVATAIRWSGTDDDFPVGDTGNQLTYCASSPKWEFVKNWTTANDPELQPGDVCVKDGHICMFVGEDLIREHEFTGDANVGDPISGACYMSGSIGDYVNPGNGPASRAPGCGIDGDSQMQVFRCINPDQSDTYSSAGSSLI